MRHGLIITARNIPIRASAANPHYLDWENQPIPFKIYPELEPISLHEHLSSSGMPALSAISALGAEPETSESCPRVRRWRRFFFSPPASPGAELIRAARCFFARRLAPGRSFTSICILSAAISRISRREFINSARRISRCEGCERGIIVQCSWLPAAKRPSIANAPCVIVSASTFWRNAWKYQARAYRHCYWDNGTVLANLLAAAAARKIPAKVVLGFVDASVNQLLGLDSRREAPLSLWRWAIHRPGGSVFLRRCAPLVLETGRLSKTEVDYPAMREMHEASSLESEEEVKAWREGKAQGETKAEGERIKDEETPQNGFSLATVE